jgi:hypothetical protein
MISMMAFFSSSTGVVNSKRAMAECIENALEGQNDLDCDLIIFYTAMGHNFRDLLSEAKRLSPNAEIIGCTGAGVIGAEGPNESMRALGIMAIKDGKDKLAIASKDSIVNTDSVEMAIEMAETLKSKSPEITMIHFLASQNDTIAEKAIEGFEDVFGPEVNIFGALSCDNMKLITNFQFYGDRVMERGAVAVGFADPDLEIITRANHGFEIIGSPFEITRAEFPFILELNGQAPWKLLTATLGFPETAQLIEVIVVAQFAQKLPEALHEEYGSEYILRPFIGKEEDGRILTPYPSLCQKGMKLWLAKRDEKGMFEGVDHMVEEIVKLCEGRSPLAVFHADCALRGRFSLNRILKDEIVNHMQYPLCKEEDVPWLGLYGGGEFAQLGGRNRIHFMTTSLYVILKRGQEVKQ